MRLDTRKSLMMSGSQTLTPTTNLLNPEWRSKFRAALEKIGGEAFKPLSFNQSPETDAALKAEQGVSGAVLNGAPSTAGRLRASNPQELQSRVNWLNKAYDRTGIPTDSARGVRERAMPNIEGAIRWGAAGDYAGNALSLLLASRFPALSNVANTAAPLAGAVPLFGDAVADDTGGAAFNPELRASRMIADAEQQRLTSEVGSGPRRGGIGAFYASRPDVLSGYHDARSRGMSPTTANAWTNPASGWSAALGRFTAGFPLVGSLVSTVAPAGMYVADQYSDKPDSRKMTGEDALYGAAQGVATSTVPWAAARAGGVNFLPRAATLFGRLGIGMRAASPAALAASAVSGGAQLTRAALDDRYLDNQRRAAGVDQGAGLAATRTLLGDPLGAAAAIPGSEAAEANKREFFQDRRGSLGSETDEKGVASGPFLPYDMDKVHVQMDKAFKAAPSVSEGVLAPLMQAALWSEAGMRHMATNPKLTPEQLHIRRFAQAEADRQGLVQEDPRRRVIEEKLLEAAGMPLHFKGTPTEWKTTALGIANIIQQAYGVTMTPRGVNELARVVATIGPDAARIAFEPTIRVSSNSDKQLEHELLRVQAVLNPKWVSLADYHRRASIYSSVDRQMRKFYAQPNR